MFGRHAKLLPPAVRASGFAALGISASALAAFFIAQPVPGLPKLALMATCVGLGSYWTVYCISVYALNRRRKKAGLSTFWVNGLGKCVPSAPGRRYLHNQFSNVTGTAAGLVLIAFSFLIPHLAL